MPEIVGVILVAIVVGRSGATVPADKDYDNDYDDDSLEASACTRVRLKA